MTNTITTWMWDSPWRRGKYSHRDVNRLLRMLDRTLPTEFQLVCFTNKPTGIDPRVKVLPLPSDPRDFDYNGGGANCFIRMWLFTQEAREVLGVDSVLNLDLDCIVTGDLSPMLNSPHDFHINAKAGSPRHYNGAMFKVTLGMNPEMYTELSPEAFKRALIFLRGRGIFPVGSDQAWMSHMIKGAPTWTAKDGVYHLWAMHDKGEVPPGCRIVFLSGGDVPDLPLSKLGET